MDTLFDPTFTYHYDKVSCMAGAYWAHVVFCQLVFCSGILACECLVSGNRRALAVARSASCIVSLQFKRAAASCACLLAWLTSSRDATLFLCVQSSPGSSPL
jgi:hypothetical protein